MPIISNTATPCPQPKGKMTRIRPTIVQGDKRVTHYIGGHQQHGTVCYTRTIIDQDVTWTFSKPASAAGR